MTEVLQVDPRKPDPAILAQAASLIARGMIVLYPTDTLYGVAVDPRNDAAIARLYAIKGRSQAAAIALIAADLRQVQAIAELSADGARLAKAWWPGPLTILLRARPLISRDLLAGRSTVGVRVPNHAVAAGLARACGVCITATSANRSGRPPAMDAEAAIGALPEADAVIDAGPSPGGKPSTIVDASSHLVSLVRAGAIAWDRVIRSLE